MVTSYTIKAGDTLSAIALRELGNANRWREITKENGQSFTEAEARRLAVGQIVYLPCGSNDNQVIRLQASKDFTVSVTPSQVSNIIGGNLENVKTYLPDIIQALKDFNILNRWTLIAAIATIGVETGEFKPIHEYGGESYFTKNYEGRSDLGNIYPGDGAKYHGRGFIQLTGRNNYEIYGKRFGVDLVNNPDLALDRTIAAKVLAAYFVDRGINQLAQNENWREVRRRVNGGYNGWDKFISLVNSAQSIIV
ncbi:glycoside hydrolase family 19 protein [Iningainema tapete]|uniref:LysM peptidoglycan-binding domain-containing protein n=1 Tax=Iningainema tapete BLCC-T55 TaxID=2748662 RepID=A0A8J6XJN1_9CYAN|nr:glycoside hydrolase family 19 protein [Iningainema tapete]MBD2777234.1 LysM peptidoglycan-binding domain-containing protein [Iningainema tapete BLCC-T55]